MATNPPIPTPIFAIAMSARHRTTRRHAGFTLVEILITATISAFLMTAVLSAMLFMNRTGFRASGYSELDTEVRRAIETFGQDARLAADIKWDSAQRITFTMPAGVKPQKVTYGYDTDPDSATYRAFYRLEGDINSEKPRRALVRYVEADFAFQRYKIEPADGRQTPAVNDLETKQIQITFRASRTSTVTAGATHQATSSRFILRNKRGGN